MKIARIAFAVVTSLCFSLLPRSLHAVEQAAPHQPGEVLLVPYFGTENGWDTLLTLGADPDGPPLAVRVRFIDGESGEVATSLNVYGLSFESWRVSLTADGAGGSTLRVAEGLCFVDEQLQAGGEGDSITIPTQVGMMEVYVMGGLTGESQYTWKEEFCDDLAARWAPGGIWESDPQQDIASELDTWNSGLMGEVTLVNVAEGLAVSYQPAALNELMGEVPHTAPGNSSPNLADADPVALVGGELIEPASGEGIDAVALALTGNAFNVYNDVISSPDINARTDWVLSYPLTPYKNYKPYSTESDGEILDCEVFGDLEPEGGDSTVEDAPSTEGGILTWGQRTAGGLPVLDITPVRPLTFALSLCRPVNVVAFGKNEAVLVPSDSVLLTQQPDQILPDLTKAPSAGLRWLPSPGPYPGVPRPVLGFRLSVFSNGVLDGGTVMRNYGILRPHLRQ